MQHKLPKHLQLEKVLRFKPIELALLDRSAERPNMQSDGLRGLQGLLQRVEEFVSMIVKALSFYMSDIKVYLILLHFLNYLNFLDFMCLNVGLCSWVGLDL